MRFIFRSSSFKSRDRKIIAAIDGHMCFPSNLICVVYFGRYCRKMFRPGDARRHHMTRKSSYRSFDRDLFTSDHDACSLTVNLIIVSSRPRIFEWLIVLTLIKKNFFFSFSILNKKQAEEEFIWLGLVRLNFSFFFF